jgi:6-phosphogluconolactonase (cycloisomerase 2 family)
MLRSRLLITALFSCFAACTGAGGPEGPAGDTGSAGAEGPQGPAGSNATGSDDAIVGAVYLTSNDSAHNEVWALGRRADGSLAEPWAFATGGTGTAASLSDQGAIFLDAAADEVFAVNAGNSTVSMLQIETDGSLTLVGAVASGGTMPVSVTEANDVVYVLNAGDATHAPNIAGFNVTSAGLTSSSVSLALSTTVAASAAVAQISFTPDGKHLVATEKGTGKLDTYEIGSGGVATGPQPQTAAGGSTATPYGFAFSGNTLLVTEAAGAVSSYAVSSTGALTAATTSASTHQAAPCWMATAGNWGWAINAGSDTITGYTVAADGTISLIASSGIAASTAEKPLDAATSADGKFLYVLDSIDRAISTYAIASDGSLTRLPDFIGLPQFAEGLAAR